MVPSTAAAAETGHVRAGTVEASRASLVGRLPAARLEACDLACRRGGRVIFRGLSFALRPGDAMLLSGPNGSGKSSLLRLLAGLTPALSGTLTWDGVPIAEDT